MTQWAVKKVRERTSSMTGVRVLHIITINEIGGAEKLLTALLPALQAAGTTIECLIFSRPHVKEKARVIGAELQQQGIPVFYAEYTTVVNTQTLDLVEDKVKKHRPHLIHVHLKHTEIWLAILKWRGKITVPVVSTIHGYRDDYHSRYGLEWQGKAKLSGYYWINKFIGRQLDGFVSISHGVTNLFTTAGLVNQEKIATIHHGTEAGQPPDHQSGGPRPHLVMIGRLVKFKGHHHAIEAVRILRNKYPDVHLSFYGKGPEEIPLKELVKKLGLEQNISFHGFVEDIAAVLPKHSIALVPSVGEPFGLVFFDAFKAGLPVVAFNIAAGNEIISHGLNGLLAKTVSGEGLAHEIEKLLKNKNLYQQIVKQAYQKMKDDFSLERMAGNYSSFYQKIINEKSLHTETEKPTGNFL